MELISSPTSLLTANKTPNQITEHGPASVFHPSVWGDYFLPYASADMEVDMNMKQNHQELKEKVRKQLVEAKGEPSQQLDLIDAIQRLGLAYHFETEIEQGLLQIHEMYHQSGHKNAYNDENLYTMSLSFRLLRQQGYPISCDVFNKFKDNNGKFKESLIADVRGLLSLYEAAHMSVHQEDILDEALKFTITHLKSAPPNLNNDPIAAQVVYALNMPIRRGLTWLESRQRISLYERDGSHNKTLLDFAKLNFNLVQKLHQRQLSEYTRWWNENFDVTVRYPFARDRVVEMFLWLMEIYYEPQYCHAPMILGKIVALTSILDDIYDASTATIEELELFNDAIQRWDVNAPDQLPDYMKHFYQKILDVCNTTDENAEQGRSYRVECAKIGIQGLTGGYMALAKWYHEGYIPSVEEYMAVGHFTSCIPLLAPVAIVAMGEFATKEALDWIRSDPLISRAAGLIGRLLNDVGSHEFEQERGHPASAVECYMKQYGATREEAVVVIEKQATDAWKDINSECLCPTAVPMPFLSRILAQGRLNYFYYKDEADLYTHSKELKKTFTSLLVDPVPI